jgi:hypothetical protein
MKIQQLKYQQNNWSILQETPLFSSENVQLVLAFGERKLLESWSVYEQLRHKFPKASIVINSTSGEIYEDAVYEDSLIVTALEFDKTQIRATKIDIENHIESYQAGEKIARELMADDLAAIMIISDGAKVNGSSLIEALNLTTAYKVPVFGGLAGDSDRFEKTLVGLNEEPVEGRIVGIGLYGNDLKIGHGSMGGWDVFGPEREVTQSAYNVVYKIGEYAALDLYKEYLGKYAAELPSAALLFPLSMRSANSSEPLVRTILSIDEEQKSMTFAGEMPTGAWVRFMKANFDRLIDASSMAAQTSIVNFTESPQFALLISCIGRKLVLKQRCDEEVEVAREIFGDSTIITGFYSYGEISPLNTSVSCELHNQTMTITTFSER